MKFKYVVQKILLHLQVMKIFYLLFMHHYYSIIYKKKKMQGLLVHAQLKRSPSTATHK